MELHSRAVWRRRLVPIYSFYAMVVGGSSESNFGFPGEVAEQGNSGQPSKLSSAGFINWNKFVAEVTTRAEATPDPTEKEALLAAAAAYQAVVGTKREPVPATDEKPSPSPHLTANEEPVAPVEDESGGSPRQHSLPTRSSPPQAVPTSATEPAPKEETKSLYSLPKRNAAKVSPISSLLCRLNYSNCCLNIVFKLLRKHYTVV